MLHACPEVPSAPCSNASCGWWLLASIIFYDLLFPLSPHYLLANGKMKDLESRRPPFKVGLVGVFSIVKCVMVAILLIEKSSLKCLA